MTVNALGQVLTSTDRNGSVHTVGYDVLGRVVTDAVTTLGSGVDGAVRRIETAYDSQGNAYLLTSYNAASSGSIVNQVQRAYNGLGQLTTEWQAHGGAVNTSTSPKVQYGYSALDSNNRSRLTSMTYPNGRVVGYNYASGLNSNISRLTSITDSGTTLESYDYLGLGTVVVRGHAQTGVDLSYVKLSGEGVGDAGDQYTGLDRFGRIVDQRWRSGSTDVDRFTYTYDRDSNRLTKTNALNSALNEIYSYDGLSQLASSNRGSGTRTQSFDYDALGNRDGVTTNGSTQAYTANKQNEITSISGLTTPTYDVNGNMTDDETGKQYVYDAWNRLVAVKSSGGTMLKTYGYDGLNRRVLETVSGTTTDLYYSSNWQVLEERVAGGTRVSNVWSSVYVDAMIARDRDTDGNGSLDERLYPTHDANFNVTGLVNTSGSVAERYLYDSYGAVTVMNASWSVHSGSAYAWQYLHQGGRLDTVSGLYHFRNRDFSPTLGRWVTLDPIRFDAGLTSLYSYLGQNPSNFVDPSGFAGMDVKLTTAKKLVQKQLEDGIVGYDFWIDFEYPKADLRVRRYFVQSLKNYTLYVTKEGKVVDNKSDTNKTGFTYKLDQRDLAEGTNDLLSTSDHRLLSLEDGQDKIKNEDILFLMQETTAQSGLTGARYIPVKKGNAISNIAVTEAESAKALGLFDAKQPSTSTSMLYVYYAGCNDKDKQLVTKALAAAGAGVPAFLKHYNVPELGVKPFEALSSQEIFGKLPLIGHP